MIVDIYFDTVCPWCRIGKRHLELALERWQGEPVRIRHRAFFLNSGVPAEGYDFKSYMAEKLGHSASLFSTPTRAGAAVGLTFNFEVIQRMPNTLLSHRLIKLTPETQRGAMIDTIYTAYFEAGRDIGDLEVLVDLARQQGLDANQMRTLLLGDSAHDEVILEVQQAFELGISGVPFFILNGKYALRGSQPPQVILGALEQVAAKDQSPEEEPL